MGEEQAHPFSWAGMQAILGPGLQCRAVLNAVQRHKPQKVGSQGLSAEQRGAPAPSGLGRQGGSGTCRTFKWLPPGDCPPTSPPGAAAWNADVTAPACARGPPTGRMKLFCPPARHTYGQLSPDCCLLSPDPTLSPPPGMGTSGFSSRSSVGAPDIAR